MNGRSLPFSQSESREEERSTRRGKPARNYRYVAHDSLHSGLLVLSALQAFELLGKLDERLSTFGKHLLDRFFRPVVSRGGEVEVKSTGIVGTPSVSITLHLPELNSSGKNSNTRPDVSSPLVF